MCLRVCLLSLIVSYCFLLVVVANESIKSEFWSELTFIQILLQKYAEWTVTNILNFSFKMFFFIFPLHLSTSIKKKPEP